MTVTAKKLGQTSLNVTANVVTLTTGRSGGHSEVSSIYLTNTNATTQRTVTLLAHGAGTAVVNELFHAIDIPAKGTKLLQLSNSPIILPDGETLRAYQDIGTDVTATIYGIEED